MAFSTVAQQEKLKSRPAPYWHKLETGKHLGLRKARGSMTWIARAYDPATRKQVKHSLGDFASMQPNERFSAASKAAREWFKHLDEGGTVETITVAQACERYAAALARGIGNDPPSETKAKEARRRFAQYVNNDPIARFELPKLKKRHVADWRARLAATPATFERAGARGVGRGKGKGTQTRQRSPLTVNRDIACLRAALNLALADGYVTTAQAWAVALKSSKAHNRRQLYLDRDQRRRLLDAIKDEPMRNFIAALAVLPLRPGALAALRTGDFNAKQGTLRIGTDKAGAGRVILLPKSTAAQIAKATKDKLPAAPMFTSRFGRRFRADEWIKAMKPAAAAAKLPAETVAYTLRHSAITDLVHSNLDLFTVAALAGTSISMIESHYGHLRQERARDALASLAL